MVEPTPRRFPFVLLLAILAITAVPSVILFGFPAGMLVAALLPVAILLLLTGRGRAGGRG